MNAEPGDDLIVDTDAFGHSERVGRILEVGGSEGHPEFLVHWVRGDYDSLISPWPGVHVRHRPHPRRQQKARGGRPDADLRHASADGHSVVS